MAERRMFAKTIIDSDAFLDMPVTARLLYYDLAMRADDDGFVNSPKKIMRMVGASQDDLGILILRKFILPFDSGVVVIKHWRIHNYIRGDTYHETTYKEEKATLELDENKAYRSIVNSPSTERQRLVDDTSTQVRLGKDSLGKDRLGKGGTGGNASRFVPPTKEEIRAYCTENGYNIDVDYFFDHYSGNGWKAGRVPMKDWKATVRNWYRRDQKEKKPGAKLKTPYDGIRAEVSTSDDLERLARNMGVNDG